MVRSDWRSRHRNRNRRQDRRLDWARPGSRSRHCPVLSLRDGDRRATSVRAAWLLTASMLCVPVLAGDCPPGCAETKATVTKKPVAKKKPAPVVAAKPVPGPAGPKGEPGPPGPKGDKGEPGATVQTFHVETTPARHGDWYAGGGAIYQDGWGLQGVVGYEWSNGLMLLAGPNWVDHSARNGTVTAHD